MQWEYKIVSPIDLQNPLEKSDLDELGIVGWELSAVIYQPQIGSIYYFKRDIQSHGYNRKG